MNMGYEFNAEEEKVFKKLSTHMVIVVILIGVAGALTLVDFIVGPLIPLTLSQILKLIEAILYLGIAATFYFPINNFKLIVTTQGRDIDELAKGFKELNKGMLFVVLLTLANAILFLIILVSDILA